jgi:hypothetical protein
MGRFAGPERASRPTITLGHVQIIRLPKVEVGDGAILVQPIWASVTFEDVRHCLSRVNGEVLDSHAHRPRPLADA